jgi:hypothetical protein
MIGDFLLRLLLALPIILLLAVGTLVLWRRTGLGPFGPGTRPTLSWLAAAPPADSMQLSLVSQQLVAPGVRVAVLRYGGQDFLVGAGSTGVTLLATLAADLSQGRPA